MIDESCPFSRRSSLAQHEADTRGASVDDAVHPLRTTMEALRRAATHLRLLDAVAIQARNDGIGDLVN
jgi:hypothetical protein